MRSLMDDMMGACADMMASGMMGRDRYDGFGDVRFRMGAAIDVHRSAIDTVTDADAMHSTCDEHDQTMDGFFDEMGGMMPGGMMRQGVGRTIWAGWE